MTPMIGTAYPRVLMIPESATARGMSRCGFSISSLALLVSSKPTH